MSFKLSAASKKSYSRRGIKAARSKFEAISAGMQKFNIAKQEVRAFQPSGTMANQNLSMSITRHLSKMSTITYDAKDFPHEERIHHLSYEEFGHISKFNYELVTPSSISSVQK